VLLQTVVPFGLSVFSFLIIPVVVVVVAGKVLLLLL